MNVRRKWSPRSPKKKKKKKCWKSRRAIFCVFPPLTGEKIHILPLSITFLISYISFLISFWSIRNSPWYRRQKPALCNVNMSRTCSALYHSPCWSAWNRSTETLGLFWHCSMLWIHSYYLAIFPDISQHLGVCNTLISLSTSSQYKINWK